LTTSRKSSQASRSKTELKPQTPTRSPHDQQPSNTRFDNNSWVSEGNVKNWIVFVDTNVLLDFYRFSGGNASEMLQQLDAHKNEIILTRQVLMEFLKNRRSAIVAAFSQLSKPIVPALPLNLRGLVVSNAMITQLKDAEASYKEIERKIKAIIETPSENDDVFKLVTTVFSSRADDEGDELFEKVSNRWQRGYPPRKDKDNSIGDALNWEAMLAVVGLTQIAPT
jgi:predicted nucleic acid-binding protein